MDPPADRKGRYRVMKKKKATKKTSEKKTTAKAKPKPPREYLLCYGVNVLSESPTCSEDIEGRGYLAGVVHCPEDVGVLVTKCIAAFPQAHIYVDSWVVERDAKGG